VNFLSTYKRVLFLAVVAFLALQCAQPSSPTGGARDEKPPEILEIIPQNETVNFNSSTIEIFFDEFIQLKDPSTQVLISPSLKNKPIYTLKNKSLLVELKDTLLENTTYSINFGESIVDNNEGNILKNFVYAFSTGDELDSLELTGKVRDAFTAKPVENMKIQLYREHSDSIPLLEKPDYFVQTDENGFFRIQYLPQATFKVFGCTDENGTLIYDDATENICFLDSLVDLSLIQSFSKDTSLDSLQKDTVNLDSFSPFNVSLISFNEETDLGYIDNLKSDTLGVYRCTFSVPQLDVKIQTSFSDSLEFIWLDKAQKELQFFTTDTGEVFFSRSDKRFNNREVFYDTLELETIDSSLVSDFTKNCKIEYLGGRKENKDMTLRLRSSRPLTSTSVNCQILLNDSLIDQLDSLSLVNAFDFEVNYSGVENSNYEFIFIPGSIHSNNISNLDTTNVRLTTFEKNYYGELILDIQSEFINPYLILKSKSGNIMYEAPYKGALKLDQVPPGELEIFLLEDLNNDGNWTTGNYLVKIQPEKYVKFSEPIEIRSNWSLSYQWVIN